ncbi:response regulator [Aestuariibacter sp. A3R04]|uniref:response regulator n=1 Tax=Aestuariibacter sp. A3R04 TaxID=2841571 RepID=UPI001C094253|nr:response regulator [Aestuariibacter sp. A3R04]MBU3022943.1 response regulator [Aestuariibacter sp. A3R04]
MKYADKRVLIVEDQRPFLLLLRGLLHGMGATEVVTKPSAEQALSLCRKRKFDIIICDLHLGVDKKNGFELIDTLRTQKYLKPDAIFMLISADSTRPVVLGSLDRGPDDYLIKPFSQAQIKSRLNRAWHKRQALLPVHQALFDDDFNRAFSKARALYKSDNQYKGSLTKILVELHWQRSEFIEAESLLNAFESNRSVSWVALAKAQNQLKMGNIDNAERLANQVIESNRFSADAYDVLAQCLAKKGRGQEALEHIRFAIKISPYSVTRHHIACRIAREHHDYELASDSALAIWRLCRKTQQQHATYWCAYIRSLLDVAEHTDDRKIKNRYQQEVTLAIQRGRADEYLSRHNDEFDLVIYEQLTYARIFSLDGKLVEAKRALVDSQNAIAHKYEKYPADYAPDSLTVMYSLGDYEEAEELHDRLQKAGIKLRDDDAERIETCRIRVNDKRLQYIQHNREGIHHYQQGEYRKAYTSFEMALKFSPVSTGVALNQLQCIVKLLSGDNKQQLSLKADCRRLTNLLANTSMKPEHQQKYEALKTELVSITGIAA